MGEGVEAREEAREEEVFGEVVVGPEGGFHAEEGVGVVGEGGVGGVALGGVGVGEGAVGAVAAPGGLGEVEVAVVVGAGDDGEALADGFAQAAVAVATVVPPLHGGAVGQRGAVGVEDVLPEDGVTAALLEVAGHLCGEPALQVVAVAEAFVGDALLAGGAAFPLAFGCLVAAQVDVGRGEEVADLVEDIVEEEEHGVAAGTEEGVGEARLGHTRRLSGAGERGVGVEGGFGVAGEVDLGHHGDMAGGGIGHDLADVGVGVAALLLLAVSHAAAHGGEARVALDVDAPAEALGEVPVEDVHLERGHEVEEGLDGADLLVLTARVEHQPAPVGARLLGEGAAGQRVAHLLEGDEGVVAAVGVAAADDDAVGGDAEREALGRTGGVGAADEGGLATQGIALRRGWQHREHREQE